MRNRTLRIVAAFVLLSLSVPCLTLASDGPIVFKKSKVMMRKENGKSDLVRSRIELFEGRLEVTRLGTGESLYVFPYDSLQGAQYSFSKSPRWKTWTAASVVVGGIAALPLAFMSGKKHWLKIRVKGDYAVLKLDKKIQRELITALEAKSGIEVERLGKNGKPQ